MAHAGRRQRGVMRRKHRLALFDLDGVLADDRHRQAHALARDWGLYFALMSDDGVWRQGKEIYEGATLTGWHVGYLTGRREQYRDKTLAWLRAHGFDDTRPLLMRPDDSRTVLAEYKAGVLAAMKEYDELMLYDDDPEVIRVVGKLPHVRVKHCAWHVKPAKMVKSANA